MQRRNSEKIGDVVRQFLRDEGLETPLNQYRLISSWGDVMGKGIYPYTGDIFIKNQTLYVQIKSSVLRQELNSMKQNIVKRLNDHVGVQVICEAIFY